MPHIHTGPGQIDMIAEVFVVYRDRVLLRFHEKVKMWIAPGGHIELDETPEETAIREAREEVGLDIELYREQQPEVLVEKLLETHQNFLPLQLPSFMNIHSTVKEGHRHISMVYFGRAATDQIIQPTNHEQAPCRWLTRAEVEADPEIHPQIKAYALAALEALTDRGLK